MEDEKYSRFNIENANEDGISEGPNDLLPFRYKLLLHFYASYSY